MGRFWPVLMLTMMLLTPASVRAGPTEEAGATLDHWAAAFNANDVDALLSLYAPDATMMGTVGLTLKQGSEAIRSYYARLADSGDRVMMGDRKVVMLDGHAAYVSGFYEFTAVRRGARRSAPARFTMVLIKRGEHWLIEHHHSSRQQGSFPTLVRRASAEGRERLWLPNETTRRTGRPLLEAAN